jgi:hypothetical protein
MSTTVRTIHDFTAAVRTALGLHEIYGRFAAVALLDDDHRIIDMTPFSGEATCVMCAVEWAHALAHTEARASHAVVFSGGEQLSSDLREDDVRLFQTVRDALEALDLVVLDWLQTDGEQLRSLAFSCDVDPSWRSDEPS